MQTSLYAPRCGAPVLPGRDSLSPARALPTSTGRPRTLGLTSGRRMLSCSSTSERGEIVAGTQLKPKSKEEMEPLEEVGIAEEVEFAGEDVAKWVGAAVAFGLGVFAIQGSEAGEEYFAGYLLEQSLSIDNLFVFILVFDYFKTPIPAQEKVLSVGIYSAAVLRAVMILTGAELIENFEPALLVFAGILIYSSYSLLTDGDDDDDEDLSDNVLIKLCKRYIECSSDYDGEKLFTIQNGVRMATPLLIALIVIEISDVIFAVDSIPAVFGVTRDPFIIYTSNIFAILSLRALYGFVSTIMSELRFLDKAVAAVLGFIGVKMVADFGGVHCPTSTSLAVVALTLAGGVAASLLLPEEPQSVPESVSESVSEKQ